MGRPRKRFSNFVVARRPSEIVDSSRQSVLWIARLIVGGIVVVAIICCV